MAFALTTEGSLLLLVEPVLCAEEPVCVAWVVLWASVRETARQEERAARAAAIL